MKKCPACNRTFEDTLTYCLIDGSVLSAPFDPHATLLIPQQNPTVSMLNPSGKSTRMLWIIGAGVTLLITATIVTIALVNRNPNQGAPVSNVTQENRAQTNESNINNRNENPPASSKTGTENKNAENPHAQSGDEQSTEDLSGLEKYAGQYAGDMFKKEARLKQRLSNLLGSNYQLFMDRWDVTAPIEEDGSILFAEGCMAHSCTIEESLLAIDTSNGIIYCAILSDSLGGKFRTFSEPNGSLPSVMKKRMQEIVNMK